MRSKFIFFFLFIFLASCSYPIKNLDSSGKTVICFGDSITKGVGAPAGRDYPSVLSDLLEGKVINAGVSGDTTQKALMRLEEDVLAKEPYLVIVELGGNDFLRKVPKRTTLKNLEKIIIRIQRSGAMVALVDISSGFILSGYRKDFKRLAKQTGSIFIPNILKGILTDPSLRFDYIHPNEKGYQIIAHRIYKAIKNYIR
jgi:acyl-CoA thioesterase-1